jgi:radical SAM protein with 4Fe4S-binding SPASM domain
VIRYLTALAMVALKPAKVPALPIHVQVEPTDKCNMDCSFCAHSKVIQHPRSMNLEEFQGIVDTIHPKKITLSGYGEPLMNRALPRMIVYAKSKGIAVNTTSNLTLLRTEKRAAELIRSGLDLINVSVDAASPETYLAVRGQDFFDRILAGIRLLLRTKAELNSRTPHVRISFVINKRNLHQVADFVRLAHSLGVDLPFFQILQLTAIGDRKERLISGVPYEHFRQALEEGRAVARELGMSTNLAKLLADLPEYWRKYDAREMSRRRCILPWFSAYITADGSVRPCCAFAPVKMDMGGSLFERDFDQIWNSERYQKFRRAHRMAQRPTQVCRDCVPESLLDIVRRTPFSPGFFDV